MNLSFISVTFNNFEDLQKTYESVQKYEELREAEFVVINGGSCSKTLEFLEKNKIKNISEKDKGISDAFNKGVEFASNSNINFLNSGDCIFNPEYFTKAIQFLEEHEEFGYVFGDIVFHDQYAGEIIISPHGKNIGEGMPCPHQSMVYRKSVFNKTGNFRLDFQIAMDYEHMCRMLNAGVKGHYLATERASVLMDGLGVSKTREELGILENKKALIENGLFESNRTAFKKKYVKFKIRSILQKLGMTMPLKIWKKLKYGSVKK